MYLGASIGGVKMTENEKCMHRACFTGHRPEKLMRSESAIRKDLEKQIRQAVTDGLNVFISGMARGVDIWAAQIVLKLRNEGADVKLICACPYKGFELGWSREWQQQYKEVLESADFIKYVCADYSRACFQIRNEWMVNHAVRVIAIFILFLDKMVNTILSCESFAGRRWRREMYGLTFFCGYAAGC